MRFYKIACGVSGGVDSLVAALLLKQRGHDVTGIFMRNWDLADEVGGLGGECNMSGDRKDAQFICNRLEIPFLEVSFVKEYWNDVFLKFISDYENGLTPNPDILCNKKIKFDAFLKYVTNTVGADVLATGHYARTSFGSYLQDYHENKPVKLLMAKDRWKDQSFFLSQVCQEALRKSMFPLGELQKSDVKKIAHQHGFNDVANKKESMGICFVGKRNFQRFMREYVVDKPGYVVDIDNGEVVGQHNGIHLYTLGQICLRCGNRLYTVVDKNNVTGDIIATRSSQHPALFSDTLTTDVIHWITGVVPKKLRERGSMRCGFQFQHVHKHVPCLVTVLPTGGVHIKIDEPMKALTCGQYAVLYKGDECLGSGVITSTGPTLHELALLLSNVARPQHELQFMKDRAICK